MKKNTLIVILVLLTLVLSGCACEHEWSQADCLNPQICTKCDEIGAQALGHDWAAATCDKAEICTRCGETQGEVLGHHFGDWTFGEADMTHSCANCGQEETAELDRELYLETLLTGFWEGYCLFHGEEVYSAYDFSQPLDTLCFGENHTATGKINNENVIGIWTFQEYKEEEGQKNYIFSLDTGKEFNWTLLLSQREDEDLLYILYPNGDQILLSDNDDLASTIVNVNSWGAEGDSGMFSLTFHADRTVTGRLSQEFQGTWQLMYQEELSGLEDFMTDTRYCDLYINCTLDGEEVCLRATIRPSRADMYNTRTEEFTPGELTLRYRNSRYTFEPMSSQEISSKQKALEEGPNMLLGTWSSLYWRKFVSNAYTDTSLSDYSITFKSDNTFIAFFGKELTGTWSYQSDLSNTANPASGSHHYYLKFDNENYYYRVELYYSDGQMPELRFWSKTTDSNNLRILFLGRLSDADNRVLDSLIGTWTSVSESINTHATGEFTQIGTTDYSFIFNDDGSFTSYIGTDLHGTWKLSRIIYNDDDSRSYYFHLNEDGSGSPYDIIIYDHADEMIVEFRETTSDYQRWVRLKKYSTEELDAVALGPTLPIGEWISTAVTHYGDGTEADKQIVTNEFSFIVSEDGTFTADLGSTIQGTWSFMEFMPDSGYYYYFDYPGKSQYGPRSFYVSKENDFLSICLISSDQESFYQMERK